MFILRSRGHFHQSTISRDAAAGGVTVSPRRSARRQRGTAASSVPRKIRMWFIVESKLGLQWSPDQISGRLKLSAVVYAEHDRHVWEDKRSGGKLYKHLRRRGKKRNSRGSGYSGRGHIPGRVDITERPQVVEDKRRVGDWEAVSSALDIEALWCPWWIGRPSSRLP